jgi:hypothetical protein
MAEALIYTCPTCGSDVRVGSSCPGCPPKSQKRSWSQPKSQDGLDLPADDFDYDSFVKEEFGNLPHRALGLPWYWWGLAICLLILLIFGVLT